MHSDQHNKFYRHILYQSYSLNFTIETQEQGAFYTCKIYRHHDLQYPKTVNAGANCLYLCGRAGWSGIGSRAMWMRSRIVRVPSILV
jgi:hypothetical protein